MATKRTAGTFHLPERERKRIATLRRRKSQADIVRDARKAGLASTKHFDSESGRRVAKKRWDKFFRENPEKFKLKLEKDAKRAAREAKKQKEK